ncbi:hypothetical protein SAMN05216588_10654 [Pseudomonas flavescens]|uniref:Uncharacterized protein n=1 Tax=Phytopseudomonas flavescens TaxID=29435 RepID=A0A1G8E3G6_9GAMM|nr:hypothetical protein SAMN05216588_10654 [Pseudomonas flavescens]
MVQPIRQMEGIEAGGQAAGRVLTTEMPGPATGSGHSPAASGGLYSGYRM